MNRKEINAMTDEELRIKAAELIGAEWFVCPSAMSQGRFLAFGRAVGWRCATGEEFKQHIGSFRIPDYVNNIEDAWELTGEVPGCRWSVYELDEGGWAAVVMGKIEPLNGQTLWDVVAESGPDTAPRAITKAFIMAMENDE